jgi:hypothetical protein
MKNKLYFLTKDTEYCQNIESIFDEMIAQGLTEMEVYEAEKTKDNNYFFCNEFGEVAEKGMCGKGCTSYNPRNGKSGACRYLGNLYALGNLVTIKISSIHYKEKTTFIPS